jgi:hypothetical protein
MSIFESIFAWLGEFFGAGIWESILSIATAILALVGLA